MKRIFLRIKKENYFILFFTNKTNTTKYVFVLFVKYYL